MGKQLKLVRTLLMLVSFLVVLGVGMAVAALAYAANLDKPAASIEPAGELFSVSKGEPGVAVARRLAAEGFIRSEYLFRFILKARGLEQSLKAGDYLIQADMGTTDIINAIVSGNQILLKVTIPEGASLRSIADTAERAGVASASSVLEAVTDKELLESFGIKAASAVGYLFPDTYLLPRDSGGQALITLMLRTFKERLNEHIPEAAALSNEEVHERVIMASIVEREFRVPEEAPLMASAFFNRLRIGMALQSCATVVYVITERQDKPHPVRLFDRDLKIDDAFNTYMHPGLPPAPICNPGLTALDAAFRPAATRYLYFRLVDEESGTHYFSESLDEHIRAAELSVKPRSR